MTDEEDFKPGQVVTFTDWTPEQAAEARDNILENKPDLWERMKLVEIDSGDFNDHHDLNRELHQFLMKEYELKRYDNYFGPIRALWTREITEEFRAYLEHEAPGLWERLRAEKAEAAKKHFYKYRTGELIKLIADKYPELGKGTYEGLINLLNSLWGNENSNEEKGIGV